MEKEIEEKYFREICKKTLLECIKKFSDRYVHKILGYDTYNYTQVLSDIIKDDIRDIIENDIDIKNKILECLRHDLDLILKSKRRND